MPDMDGIAATERLSAEVPGAAVVMMSVQGEADYLRRSMLAGAREFLVKPFSSDELTASIRQVYITRAEKAGRIALAPAPRSGETNEAGPVVAVFSPKGGVGRTTDRGQPGRRRCDGARQEGHRRRRARSSSATSRCC